MPWLPHSAAPAGWISGSLPLASDDLGPGTLQDVVVRCDLRPGVLWDTVASGDVGPGVLQDVVVLSCPMTWPCACSKLMTFKPALSTCVSPWYGLPCCDSFSNTVCVASAPQPSSLLCGLAWGKTLTVGTQ